MSVGYYTDCNCLPKQHRMEKWRRELMHLRWCIPLQSLHVVDDVQQCEQYDDEYSVTDSGLWQYALDTNVLFVSNAYCQTAAMS